MNTSKNYPGQNVLISYLKKQGSNSSYYGFLNLYYNVIVTSTISDDWKSLDNAWSTHFLEEAEKLNLNQKFLKEKKNYYINNFGSRSRNLMLNLREYSLGTTALVVTNQELFEGIPGLIRRITINAEHLRYADNLQIFWKRIIKENKKENISSATTNAKAFQQDFHKKAQKNTEIQVKLSTTTVTSHPKVIEFSVKELLNAKASQQNFHKKAQKNTEIQVEQKSELTRVRDDDDDGTDIEHWKKQSQILKQNKNNLAYKQVVDNALLIASSYESLIADNIIPFIKILKNSLLTRSRMSLSSANESMLQAIVENLLPAKYCISELSLVMNGKKPKGSGRFGYLDIFILSSIGNNNMSLELKYISLVGLINGGQKNNFNSANELEDLGKILEKENEASVLKRPYSYWSKEDKKTNLTTIGEILNNGVNQLNSYMKTISKGRVINYSSSGVFDEHIKITKSKPNKLKGFVILVIGFHRILWRSSEEFNTISQITHIYTVYSHGRIPKLHIFMQWQCLQDFWKSYLTLKKLFETEIGFNAVIHVGEEQNEYMTEHQTESLNQNSASILNIVHQHETFTGLLNFCL
ncbi:hypothetical protein C1646_759487 [Rhizophagus diaphanus]|nr:hypothetical protein C1646_759487 [Rhizophagus diaphanus] [Rhizophagus sp. MUCL 43196]